MLGWRVSISAVLIPSLFALFWYDSTLGRSAWVLLAFCLLAALRNAYELSLLLMERAMRPQRFVAMAGSAAVVAAGWAHTFGSATSTGILESIGWIGATLVGSFCVLLLTEAVRFNEPGNSMESLGSHLITVLYAGALLAVTAQFRWFPDARLAYFAVGSLIITVKSGDTGAYFFGRFMGKRKMAPRLSPGKTWMGAVGAVVGSCVGGSLWLYFGGKLFDAAPQAAAIPIVLAYCASLGVVGLLGDLCESLIKRDVRKKDSAPLMPGFGGLLDLLDSPLFAGPFALVWWHLLPPAIAL